MYIDVYTALGKAHGLACARYGRSANLATA